MKNGRKHSARKAGGSDGAKTPRGHGAVGRDKLGREPRAERRRLARLMARRAPLVLQHGSLPLTRHFPSFLRDTRQRMNLSLNALATLTGIARQTLAAIEKGRHSTHLHTIERFCWGVNIPIDKFLRQLKRRADAEQRKTRRAA